MQIYMAQIEVDLEDTQVEAIESVDQLLGERLAELRALMSLVTNSEADVTLTRQGPYTRSISVPIPVPGEPA